MTNMSYCRFENTAQDLADCFEHFDDNLQDYEFRARTKILKLAAQIVEQYGENEFEEKSDDEEDEQDEN